MASPPSGDGHGFRALEDVDPVVGELAAVVAAAATASALVAVFDLRVVPALDRLLHGHGLWGSEATVVFVLALLLGGTAFVVRRWRDARRANRRLSRLERSVHQLQDSFFVEDLDGVILFANDACARELGYEVADELVGRHLSELVPAELLEDWTPGIEEMVRTGEPRAMTYELPREDGRTVHRRARLSPLRDGNGRIVGIVGIAQDVSELERAREELSRNERRLQAAQRLASVGSWEWAIPENEIHWSEELYRIFGVEPEAFEADYEAFLRTVHPGDRERVEEEVGRTLETGEPYRCEFRIVRDDGEVRAVRGFGELETGGAGEPLLLRGVAQDVTELKAARDRADELQRRYRTLFSMSPVAFAVSTPDGEVVDVNRAWTEEFGYDREGVVGRDVSELGVWDDPRDREEVLDRLVELGAVRGFETTLRTRSGELREVELSVDRLRVGGAPRLSWSVRDVTERNEYQRQLERQALHDSLTGLPNRNLLLDRLNHALDRARRGEKTLALLFVDLDDFKAVNDSFGHAAGDEVLKEAARRMTSSLRREDTAARLSGDEFVVLLEDTGETEARTTAERILSALEDPFEVEEARVSLGASVGLAVREEGEEGVFSRGEDLLQAADSAMYRAKQGAAGGLHVFAPDEAGHRQRLRRKERLRSAIEDGELVVYYQPVMDLQEDRVVGAEALVRWAHPQRGLIPPGDFIPLAEETGLIRDLDDRVLAAAVRQAARWREDSGLSLPADFLLGVNVAPHRYDETDLADRLLEQLEAAGFPPGSLQLEITERLALKETRPLHELRREGVRLAIDDFGTGYSSLMYLRHLDADALKVDRYFVQELEEEASTSIIVRSVLSIGAHMGLDVIAEGVETEGQRDHLRALGCRLAQGFFFARPMPAADFEELFRSGGPAASS